MNAGRRYKVYQAETGITYRYFFDFDRRVVRPEGQGAGSDFVFVVIPDQRLPLVLRVFVSDRALVAWRERRGRELDSREQYMAAKMRLFWGFDERAQPGEDWLGLVVDETNVESLLAPLGLV